MGSVHSAEALWVSQQEESLRVVAMQLLRRKKKTGLTKTDF